MIPFGELKSQFSSIESEIRAAINEVLESAWYIHGKQCGAFESEFAAYTGTQHAVGVASGTGGSAKIIDRTRRARVLALLNSRGLGAEP